MEGRRKSWVYQGKAFQPERISEQNLGPGRRAGERSRDDPEEGGHREGGADIRESAVG